MLFHAARGKTNDVILLDGHHGLIFLRDPFVEELEGFLQPVDDGVEAVQIEPYSELAISGLREFGEQLLPELRESIDLLTLLFETSE